MTFTIKGSHIVALLITAVIGFYMYNGSIEIGGQVSEAEEKPAIANRSPEEAQQLFRVSYTEIVAEPRIQKITMRGRTQADATIPIRSETSGILRNRFVERGDLVEKGQLVCEIARDAREANLSAAKASLEKAEADFASNSNLQKQGFATDSRMRELSSAVDAAKAQVEQAQVEIKRTEIRANVSGKVIDPIAETGDVLSVGGTCITIVDTDPMYFIGQLSESDIASIETGMTAGVSVVTGQNLNGTITYISPAADAQTRTFRVEIRLDKTDSAIRDGLTAVSQIALAETQAFRLSPSWLTLNNEGQVGIKIIDENDQVKFQTVNVISQTNNGFWVDGLKDGTRVITLGQEYVVSGEKVEPVLQSAQVKGS